MFAALHKLAPTRLATATAAACVLVPIVSNGRDAGAAPVQIDDFGPNPGNLDMFAYSPASAGENAPLVLVLHGCTQTAASMSAGGFEPLADEFGFHLVFPQQKRANNLLACFNWAAASDLVRGAGENQSIASMVEKMRTDHSIDPARIFIIGFSAGAAMTSVMLATWPDLFAGGAIASGLPYRCATELTGASECQNLNLHPDRKKTPAEWGDLVRAAFPAFTGPRPRVFIIHGTSDFVVHPDNAIELVDQWTDVHRIDTVPEQVEQVAGAERSRHLRGDELVVESWVVPGMGHAFPIGDDPEHACGTVAAFFEDRDLCAAFRALSFFGLTGQSAGDGGGVDGGSGADSGGQNDGEDGDDGGSDPTAPGQADGDAPESAAGCAAVAGARHGAGGAAAALVLVALALSMAPRLRPTRSPQSTRRSRRRGSPRAAAPAVLRRRRPLRPD